MIANTDIHWKKVPLICTGFFLLCLPLVNFDEPFSNWLHLVLKPHDGWLEKVTLLGDGFVLTIAFIALTIILLLVKNRWWKRSALILGCLVISAIPTQLLKFIFGRPRPYLEGDSKLHEIDFSHFYWFSTNHDFHSFPSGHSASVFVVAWIIIKRKDLHWTFRTLVMLGAIVVCITRIGLAKHFLTDTVAGALVGIAVSETMMNLHEYWLTKKHKPTLNDSRIS